MLTNFVPSDLLAGLSHLLDDKKTGDITFIVYERQAEPVINNSSRCVSLDSHVYRKRNIYAHSTILSARSQYFRDMLSSDWQETEGSHSIVRIVDFDFATLLHLLFWLYTNESELSFNLMRRSGAILTRRSTA